MLDPDDPTVRTAVFGKQMEEFLLTEIGDYLLKRAAEQYQAGVEELKKASPYSPIDVQTAQNKIRVTESILNFIEEAIKAGGQSTQILEQEHDNGQT